MGAGRGGVARVAAVWGVGAAVAAVVATGCTAGPASDPAPTESSSAAAAPEAVSPAPTRTTRPGSKGPETTGPASARPAATKPVPAGPVMLLHDGAPPEPGIEENTPWQKAEVRVPICWQDVPLTGAVERRAVSALVDMERWTEGLVVFRTADQAVRFMEVARISVTECAAGDGSPWQGRMAELPGVWGDGVAISYGSSTSPSSTPGPPLGETTVVVARVGRAVTYAWRGSHGILASTVNARGVTELRPALDHVAPQLCRYTRAGC